MKWVLKILMKRWNRNLSKLLTALLDHDLSTLEVWELFPGKSVRWVHTFIDDAKRNGYVDDRLEQGGQERRYSMRRIVSITDLGRFALPRLNLPDPPPASTTCKTLPRSLQDSPPDE